jgi:hypothetical protein
MVFLMPGHFDLKKSHFDSRNWLPDGLLDWFSVSSRLGVGMVGAVATKGQ